MRKTFKSEIFAIFLIVFLVRLLLSYLPSFTVDMRNWMAWSYLLGETGIKNFYSSPLWTDYTPGFLYYLRFLGLMDRIYHFGRLSFPFLIKLPVIIADLLLGLVIYRVLKSKGLKSAILGFLAYTLNPAVIFVDSVWGQTDGLISFFLILAAFYLVEKKSAIYGFILWAIALLVKPQALAALPVLLVFSFKNFSLKKTTLAVLSAIVVALLLSLPFFLKNPILGLPRLIAKMSNESPFTSVMAFNFWAVAKGMWISDSITFMGVTYYAWGIILLSLATLIILFKLYFSQKAPDTLYKYLSLILLAFFIFPTRIHERYVLIALPFLLTSALLSGSSFRFLVYILVSLLSLINIYHPYAYYTKESFLANQNLLQITTNLVPVISISFIFLFMISLFGEKIEEAFNKIKIPNLIHTSETDKFPEVKFITRWWKLVLLGVFAFALLVRVYNLRLPDSFYFDEVYHAFTAREILRGNPASWEWWNTPPEGFAYEWTHPPLAKLGMALGMKVFGENSFGWRFPGAILGVGSVIMVFFITKEIFKDDLTGILASSIFALDGLPLVMSRIGMNDGYFLFFILLSLFLFLQDKYFFSSLAFGLAASSKWSAIWAIPIFVAAHFALRKKFKINYFWYLLIPPLIYLSTYIPMFLSSHSWGQFIEVQKQMWWYHTNLKAEHSYSSPWWSWPFLGRPIYLYTSDESGGMVARIYAMGNPIVFWFGLVAIGLMAFKGLIKRNLRVIFIVFSYLTFFVPWAFSPRIMFLYHYLPSLPFLAMAAGYVLRRSPKLILPVLGISLLAFVYFYPHFIGMKIPLGLDKSYYWFPSWR